MNKYLLLLTMLSVSHFGLAQGEEELDPWLILSQIKYKQIYDEKAKGLTSVPEFSAALKARENTEIVIIGYYLPFDLPEKNRIILSFYPYASCFFCGGGGPESVVEVELKKAVSDLQMDELVRVRGKLKLNDKDWDRLVFIIENAEIIERI